MNGEGRMGRGGGKSLVTVGVAAAAAAAAAAVAGICVALGAVVLLAAPAAAEDCPPARPLPEGGGRSARARLAEWKAAPPPRPERGITISPAVPLQDALDRAADGAVLCLQAGEYAGPVRLTRPVTLWGPQAAVVRSSGEGSTVTVEADGVRLQGFSVAGSGRRFEQTDAAVLLRGRDLSAEGLHISDALFGISVERSARVRVAGNEIIGTGERDLGLRGDAIRFWEVHDSVIENNLVRESRDIVVWYSPDNLMRGNRVEDGRYGTHFMYSSRNATRDNIYLGNVVGVFVMYCDEVEVAGNLMAEGAPPGGMGLGLKDAGNVQVLDNRMIRNPVGIYIDTSPIRRDHENRFRGNALDFCDAGIVFHRSETRNAFEGNDLRGCPVPVRVEGGGDARGVRWSGNYFDDYSGYDLDGDGAGDVPYEQRSLSLQLTSRHENLRFFRGTPAFGLLDVVSKVFPVLAPRELLRDESPRMAANLAREVADAH